MPRIVNFPKTQTILAFGVLVGCLYTGKLDWNTAFMMVLTFYFTKENMRQNEP